MKRLNNVSIGKIRIIGGQWRGRKLSVLKVPGLRPTTNLVRETLFNWLSSSIINARCLDCCAGSGALSLEALSRYAASATLLETKYSIVKQLKRNLSILKITNAKVVNISALTFLAQPGTQYNIVFVDPPFRKGSLLQKILILLEQNNWLANGAFVYVESKAENNKLSVPVYWNLCREKETRKVIYRLYYRKAL